MRILFLGDIVGPSGCNVVKRFLPDIIKKRDLDFVVANGENAADSGLGITEKISKELFYWSLWLLLIIIWNYGWPTASPLSDVLVAVLLSLFFILIKKIRKF